MHIRLKWSADSLDVFTSATVGAKTRRPVHLLAEALPYGGWDWAAWSHHERADSLSGQAATREAAMLKAETAARAIRISQAVAAA